MTTLGRINGEALSVPGLRFWGGRIPTGFRIVAQNERGAIELWQGSRDTNMGAVEIHSPVAITGDDPLDCEILGGDCWISGDTGVFSSTFAPMIRASDSAGILRELARWHSASFGYDER